MLVGESTGLKTRHYVARLGARFIVPLRGREWRSNAKLARGESGCDLADMGRSSAAPLWETARRGKRALQKQDGRPKTHPSWNALRVGHLWSFKTLSIRPGPEKLIVLSNPLSGGSNGHSQECPTDVAQSRSLSTNSIAEGDVEGGSCRLQRHGKDSDKMGAPVSRLRP